MDNLTLEQKLERLEQKINTLLSESVEGKGLEDKKTMDAMGRITIPKTFRKVLGIDSCAAEFKILLVGDRIILEKVLDK